MFCPKCGKEVKEGARFCDRCGAPITQEEAQGIQDEKQGSGEKKQEEKAGRKKYAPRILILSAVIILSVVFICQLAFGVINPSRDRKLIRRTGDGVLSGDEIWTEYSYDSEGNLTQEVRYENYAVPMCISSYDSRGNLIEEIHYLSDDLSDENIYSWYKYEYSYDNDGNIMTKKTLVHIENQRELEWGLSNRVDYSYDSEGNITKEVTTYYDGYKSYSRWNEYSYDKNSNIIEKTYVSDDTIYEKWKYSYDKNGNVIEETFYMSNGKIGYKREYRYDKNGNVTRETRYDGDGSIRSKYKYKYDKNGNTTRRTYYLYHIDGRIQKWVTTYKNKYE